MKIGMYHFRPGLIASIVVLMGIIILVKLGSWQLIRADEKKQILADVEIRKTAKPMTLNELDNKDDKNYYHLKLEGYFDNRHYLLLDNRFFKGRVGFEVIQPFIIDNRVVLVNRGWIPLPVDRNNLPQIPAQEGTMELYGEVSIPVEKFILKADQLEAESQWPQLIQSIDIKALTKVYGELEMSIEPWVLRQDRDADPFYQRLWIFVNMTPERHISYAITWFGMALALLIIYIAAFTSRKEIKIGTD